MKVGEALRRLLTQDLGLKALALATAIFLFSLVRGSEDAQRAIYVDVTALTPPASSGKMLVSELPDKVKVTLRGSRAQLSEIAVDAVTMDITDPSMRYFYFEPGAFDLPAGVTVVDLAPASIPLTWADRGERRIPLSANLVGEVAAGLQLGGPASVRPGAVLVRGPRRAIEPIDRVETEPIDLGSLGTGRHQERVRLERPPMHAEYVDVSSVLVTFEIVPLIATRAVDAVEVTQVGGAARATLQPERVQVTVRGRPERVEALAAERLLPFVDVSELPAGGGAVRATVQLQPLPEGLEVVSVDPPEVFVTLPARPVRPQ